MSAEICRGYVRHALSPIISIRLMSHYRQEATRHCTFHWGEPDNGLYALPRIVTCNDRVGMIMTMGHLDSGAL